MATRKIDISIETRANISGAKQAEAAIDRMGEESVQTGEQIVALEKKTERLNQELARTASTSSLVSTKVGSTMSGKFGQAGFQIQDFAVQVGAGTSAMTAFAQQAPQFLGVFGPAGAIAGAIVAVGAVAANVFLGMSDNAKKVKEDTKSLDVAIEDIAKSKTDELDQEFEDTARSIDNTAARAKALKEGLEEVIKAENKLALAVIDRNAKEREAVTAEVNRGLVSQGLPADNRRVEADKVLREQERSAELARQGVATEDAKVASAREALVVKMQQLEAEKAAKQLAEETLKIDREKLQALRDGQALLEKQAKQKIVISGDIPTVAELRSLEEKDTATKSLANNAPQRAEISALEGRIALMEEKTREGSGDFDKSITKLEIENSGLLSKVQNLAKAAELNKQSIELDSTPVVPPPEVVSTQQREAEQKIADATRQAFSDLAAKIPESAKPQVAAIEEKLRRVISDGQQKNEGGAVDELLRQLIPLMERNNTGNVESFQLIIANANSAIAVFEGVKSQLDEQSRRIRTLEVNAKGAIGK